MRKPSKQNRRRRGNEALKGEPLIPEIRAVLRDTIQTLITSFAEFGPEDRGLIAKVGIDNAATLSRVRDPDLLREIRCLQRAIELLSAVENLDLGELIEFRERNSVPRRTPNAQVRVVRQARRGKWQTLQPAKP